MSSKPTKFQTKLKRFIYNNHIEAKDIVPFSQKVDPDGYGLGANHIYLIQNGKHSASVKTIVLLCKALSFMLKKRVTPNDIIDFE